MLKLKDGIDLYMQATRPTQIGIRSYHFSSWHTGQLKNTVTGYSPFFLLHGREMTLPSRENLKPQLPKENFSPDQRLENLKSSLRMAYKLAAKANRKSHYNNKRLYDRKAKLREFQVKDLVYLYYPVRKPGLTKKFCSPWSGPFEITRKISELN
jgi:hypothetical protein